MSSDTAQLLREHVNATKAMIDNEKPDRVKENTQNGGGDVEPNSANTR